MTRNYGALLGARIAVALLSAQMAQRVAVGVRPSPVESLLPGAYRDNHAEYGGRFRSAPARARGLTSAARRRQGKARKCR